MTSLGALYRDIRGRFHDAGVETPDLDARLLISHALGCAPGDVVLKPDAEINAAHPVLWDAVARRLAHEPVARIIGEKEFYGLPFRVSADVLDPRPDTEVLVDAARPSVHGGARVLDLCTGTGCIMAALLMHAPGARGVAADVSAAALEIARDNFSRLGLADRVEVVRSDWLSGVSGPFDVLTCNPPYIPTGTIPGLAPDVRLYDPVLALDGGDDGLGPYRIVFPQIRSVMRAGGAAFFECGAGQAPNVARLAEECGLQVTGIVRDLGGTERVVCLRA